MRFLKVMIAFGFLSKAITFTLTFYLAAAERAFRIKGPRPAPKYITTIGGSSWSLLPSSLPISVEFISTSPAFSYSKEPSPPIWPLSTFIFLYYSPAQFRVCLNLPYFFLHANALHSAYSYKSYLIESFSNVSYVADSKLSASGCSGD